MTELVVQCQISSMSGGLLRVQNATDLMSPIYIFASVRLPCLNEQDVSVQQSPVNGNGVLVTRMIYRSHGIK